MNPDMLVPQVLKYLRPLFAMENVFFQGLTFCKFGLKTWSGNQLLLVGNKIQLLVKSVEKLACP